MEIPQTPADLWLYVKQHFGVGLPHKSFTVGHSTPFHFLAEAFFHPDRDLAAWACRSGVKTLAVSILAALIHKWQNGVQARVLSGSEDQAKMLYGYFQKWATGFLHDRLDGEPSRLLTKVGGGQFEVLAASPKRVRGGKVHCLYLDEYDEIDDTLVQASAGMIDSRGGIAGRTLVTSTWHKAAGPMRNLVDGSPANGVKVHKWAIWESIAKCSEERHERGMNCGECPLGKVCIPKAREFHCDPDRKLGMAAECVGLYQVEDVIKAHRKLDKATWEAEYECSRPSTEGLVYRKFDPARHMCKTPPRHLEYYRAVDWGSRCFACSWFGYDKVNETWYVLDTYRSAYGKMKDHIKHIKAHRIRNVKDTFVDPAGRNINDQTGRSNIDVFLEHGIPCNWTLAKRLTNVQNGIGWVRALLDPMEGKPKLYYVPTPGNAHWVRSMQSYHNRKINGQWVNEPQKPQEYDHCADLTRYLVANMRKSGGITVVRTGAY